MQETSPQKADLDEAEKQIRLIIDDLTGVQKCDEHFFLSLEKYIDWSFVACLGTLIWFMGSFDKFKVNGEFYNKTDIYPGGGHVTRFRLLFWHH